MIICNSCTYDKLFFFFAFRTPPGEVAAAPEVAVAEAPEAVASAVDVDVVPVVAVGASASVPPPVMARVTDRQVLRRVATGANVGTSRHACSRIRAWKIQIRYGKSVSL